MPQSPYRLLKDLKRVEWNVKPYYTLPILNQNQGNAVGGILFLYGV